MIIGWFLFLWIIGLLDLFLPNMGSVVAVASQGRFFLLLRHFLQKGHIWSTKVISGPFFSKNDDIWSDVIIFYHILSTLVSAS